MSASARLFVALDPPMWVSAALAQWGRAAAASVREHGGQLRLLDPQQLHLTLCFLGNQPTTEIGPVADAVRTAGASAAVGELSLGAPLWLPARRPRALAVEIHDDDRGGLGELHQALTGGLRTVCELPREPRRLHAHVTVARLSRGDVPRERTLPATPAWSFRAPALVLYRSWLSPAGADYQALAQVELEEEEEDRPGRGRRDG